MLANNPQVEAVLVAHPDVAAASVFGLPSPLMGEMVAASVTLHGGPSEPSLHSKRVQELQAWCRQRLGHYKVPATVCVCMCVCMRVCMCVCYPDLQ